MPDLTNPRGERVRSVRALAGRRARDRSGLFVVEGPQGVREAVQWLPERVRAVYVTAAAAQRYEPIVAAAVAAGVPVWTGTPEVLAAMSPVGQGVVAVAGTTVADLATVLAAGPRLVAVLCQVRDPGNAGTVIRAADAAGAAAVVFAGPSVDVHNPKVVRATAGSLFHLPVVAGVDLVSVVDRLRGAGLTVLAADGAGALDLDELVDRAGGHDRAAGLARADRAGGPGGDVPDLALSTAWVFGNEAWGLPGADRALADAVVRVPVHGHAESLNLAAAAAVCLYASAHAQRSTRA